MSAAQSLMNLLIGVMAQYATAKRNYFRLPAGSDKAYEMRPEKCIKPSLSIFRDACAKASIADLHACADLVAEHVSALSASINAIKAECKGESAELAADDEEGWSSDEEDSKVSDAKDIWRDARDIMKRHIANAIRAHSEG
jgi:hypothetical protein